METEKSYATFVGPQAMPEEMRKVLVINREKTKNSEYSETVTYRFPFV